MRSTTVLTCELDDACIACEELQSGLERSLSLGQHSVGLLFSDPEIDHNALLPCLQQAFSFPILGCSSIGALTQEGFRDFCASLTVLTADDCWFGTALSGPLTAQNAELEIAAAYHKAVRDLPSPPELILVLPPHQEDIVLDLFPQVLGRISNGVPVFGGVASSNPPDFVDAVFADGLAYTDRMALIAIAGGIRPVFASKNRLEKQAQQKRTITKAEGSTIYRVGDMPITQYLQSIGVVSEAESDGDLTFSFGSNPLLVESPQDNSPAYMRSIRSLDMDAGTACTVGQVPEGSTISIGAMNKSDIYSSTIKCIEDLESQMKAAEAGGYQFSTVLCSDCVGRLMITIPDSGLEGNLLAKSLGERLTLTGLYGNGEICPVHSEEGKLLNRFHTHSINLCAF